MNPNPCLTCVAVSGLTLLSAACQSPTSSSSAPKSRVQAVLASTTGAATNLAQTNAAPAPTQSSTSQPPQARPPLCSGQLTAEATAFKPKALPERQGASANKLSDNPLATNGTWTWLNFWAAWCVPCKQELPLLMRWQAQLHNQVSFAFVSLDDDERQLSRFLDEQPASGLKHSYWLPDGPKRSAWLEALQLDDEPELPLQVLIDPQGKTRCRVQGAIEPSDLAALQQIVSAAK